MTEKELKRSPYWLRERNKKTYNVKKSKVEQQADTSHQNKLEICSYAEKCRENAQKKKIEEIASKSLTISIENTCLGMKNNYSVFFI